MQIKSSRETNKNIFFFGQWGSYNCLFFSLTSQQPIKGSKFFVPMEIVENVHPMTRLKFLISSAQSPYNIQSIQYYSSITKLNLWSRSNYFFLFCLCPIFRQKNWYITHHNNLLHSRRVRTIFFFFVCVQFLDKKIGTSRIIITSFTAVAWTRQPLVLSHNTLPGGSPTPAERVLRDRSVVWKKPSTSRKSVVWQKCCVEVKSVM